jgi:hypothetical protein
MVKKIFNIFLVSVLLLAVSGSMAMAKNKKLPWRLEEKLTFSIRWGVITCGYAHMEVKEKVKLNNRETFRIVSTARSATFFDAFYKVRDRAESYMDVEDLYTVRYEQSNREGSYKKDLTIIYDHAHKVAYENGKKFEITEGVQDVLSALYFLRTKELKVGESYEFDVGTGKKNWPLVVDVLRKEKIKVPGGKFKTIVVQPKLREEGIFKAKGDLEVWLTDDKRKMPVKMKSDIEFGTISAVLIDKKMGKK